MTEREQRQTELRQLRQQMRDLKKREDALDAQEREAIKADLQYMVGKCFSRKVGESKTREYAIIIDVPQEEHTKACTIFNEYQLPAIHFLYNEDFCAPFETHQTRHAEDLFWFETIFAGELPAEYNNGAYNGIGRPQWREITLEEFKKDAFARYSEFIGKICK